MNEFEKKARILVRDLGRTKAKQVLRETISQLNEKMLKATSINEGIDISNEIADCKAIIERINNSSK